VNDDVHTASSTCDEHCVVDGVKYSHSLS
jgi:hypothetical protein